MKTMKKMLALLAAMVMVLALCVPAYAADTYSITIENSMSEHTYEAYQIMTGDLSTDDNGNKILSNAKWGSNVISSKTVGADVTEEEMKEITDTESAIALVDTSGTPAGTTDTQTDGKYTISGLAAGYYLIKDKDGTISGVDDTYTRYIVQVLDNVSMAPKSNKPSSQKKVKDVNDSEANSTTGWQDSADYDIGDKVPFQLKATIASDYDSYEVYKLTFHDVERAGLTFDSSTVKVYVDETEISTGYEVKTSGLTDGCTFEVSFSNLKTITSVKANSVITVEYNSKLNENAVIGSTGNPNTMHITYSNNPNDNQGGENGKGPDDKVIVFTYTLDVNKVDSDKKALKGAGFTLYKKNASSGEYEAVGAEVTGTDMTTFKWKGLDDGDYKIVETTTPTGYNTAADLEFTISADHDTLSDNPTLTTLSGGDKVTGVVGTGILSTDVVNNAGSELPSTGGIGTTIFFVVGGILAAGAAILLITRRRIQGEME